MQNHTLSHTYRGRIAPSPTGLLHLGHARTFLTAYDRAREAGGTLVLRDEDLDPQRSKTEFARAMVEDLRWLGITWQEGPAGLGAGAGDDFEGSFGPYRQSERRSFYLDAWRRLRDGGRIYPCRCSRRELAQAALAPHEPAPHGVVPHELGPHEPAAHDEEPLYPGTCRPSEGEAGEGEPVRAEAPAGANWRFRVPDGEAVAFTDGRMGPQRFVAGQDFGDFLVWRRDDVPAYQLAVVVDDAAMRITEVVRGADLLLSTARQILLARALGVASPASSPVWSPSWYHCELLLDEHGRRLAKRHEALSLRALRERGVSAEQVRRLARGAGAAIGSGSGRGGASSS